MTCQSSEVSCQMLSLDKSACVLRCCCLVFGVVWSPETMFPFSSVHCQQLWQIFTLPSAHTPTCTDSGCTLWRHHVNVLINIVCLQLAPENTLMSFEKAVEAGSEGLETDVTIRSVSGGGRAAHKNINLMVALEEKSGEFSLWGPWMNTILWQSIQ